MLKAEAETGFLVVWQKDRVLELRAQNDKCLGGQVVACSTHIPGGPGSNPAPAIAVALPPLKVAHRTWRIQGFFRAGLPLEDSALRVGEGECGEGKKGLGKALKSSEKHELLGIWLGGIFALKDTQQHLCIFPCS